jgi:hypothetical protein
MLVETYEAVETGFDGQVECDAEALAIIEAMGLSGQQKLVAKTEAGDEVRNPYRKMTADEGFIYNLLLTKHTALDKYSDGAIPLRVLQVAAHSKDHADVKDPILVGENGDTWSAERFLLARWGEVLEPLNELRKLAAAKLKAKLLGECAKAASHAQADVAAIEAMSLDAIAELGPAKAINYYGL